MSSKFLNRILQVDAHRLDKELVNILKQSLLDILYKFKPEITSKIEPEVTLFLHAFLHFHSIHKTHASFGQKLLAIEYEGMTATKSCLFFLFTYGRGYIYERLADFSRGTGMQESWQRTISEFVEILDDIDKWLSLGALLNFLIFLKSGVKPLLVDRLLRLTQVSTLEKRYMNTHMYKQMTREMLWHSYIQLLILIIPFINYRNLTRKLKRLSPWYVKNEQGASDVRVMDMATLCAHCGEKPILPHHMGCQHLFCYYCLKANIHNDPDYECPQCGYAGQHCHAFETNLIT